MEVISSKGRLYGWQLTLVNTPITVEVFLSELPVNLTRLPYYKIHEIFKVKQ